MYYNAGRTLSALTLVAVSVLVAHSASVPTSSTDAFKTLSSGDDPANLAVPHEMNGDEVAEQAARSGSKPVRHRSLDSDLLSNDDGSSPPVAQSANAPSSPNLSITAPSTGSAGGSGAIKLLHQPSPMNSVQPRRFQDDSVAEDAKQFMAVVPPPDQNPQRKRHTQSHLSTSYEAVDIRSNNSPKNSFQPRRFQDDSVAEDAKQFMAVVPPPDQNPQRKHHTQSHLSTSYEAADLRPKALGLEWH